MSLAFKAKDHNGVPLAFDFSPCRSLMAVGFEDDSFITYHLAVKGNGDEIDVIPIMRGVGHKNFIHALKFDTFFQQQHRLYLESISEYCGDQSSKNSHDVDSDSNIGEERPIQSKSS